MSQHEKPRPSGRGDVTNQILGHTDTITGMRKLRNEKRDNAEAWEQIALRLSVAAAIGAVALTVTGTLWVFLFIWSGVIAASSAYLAATVMGVL